MGLFAAAYRISADDVSEFGGHRYLASSHYQSAVWESLLADAVLAERPGAGDEFDRVTLLYQDQYNGGLAPISVGERVAVLVSLEERGPSTLCVCFRVLRRTGEPVACGFQRVAFTSRATGEPAPF